MTTQTIPNHSTSCTEWNTGNSKPIPALDYVDLNTSIKETFAAIDRFEWQAVDKILQMREQQIYLESGYKNFEEYCQR